MSWCGSPECSFPGMPSNSCSTCSFPPRMSAKMLRVFRASGEEVLAIQFEELVGRMGIGEQPVRALDLKRYLHRLCELPRFRQRLLPFPDGQIISDDVTLKEPADVQLVLLLVTPSAGFSPLSFWGSP